MALISSGLFLAGRTFPACHFVKHYTSGPDIAASVGRFPRNCSGAM